MKKTYLAVLVLCALPVLAYAWEDRPPRLILDHYADPPAIARSGPQFDGDLLGPRSSPFSEGVRSHPRRQGREHHYSGCDLREYPRAGTSLHPR
jgi:hypothetical protein